MYFYFNSNRGNFCAGVFNGLSGTKYQSEDIRIFTKYFTYPPLNPYVIGGYLVTPAIFLMNALEGEWP